MADSTGKLTDLLAESSITLDATASSKEDAIQQAGEALLSAGAIDASYIDAMQEREKSVSTFVGEGVAIPHGTLAGKDSVKQDALVLRRYPATVDWDGNPVTIVIGIAAKGNGHIGILSALASILMEPEKAETLRNATSAADVYELLASEEEDE